MTRTDTGYTLGAIVERFGGELIGDADIVVNQVAPLSSALSGHISFLTNLKYRRQLQNCKAGAVILGVAERDTTDLPRILSDNPYAYFAKVSALLNPRNAEAPGIHSTAIVGQTATVPASATIGAFAFVGEGVKIGEHVVIGSGCHLGEGVEIGDNSLLYPQVVVYHGCVVGKRAILHSGAVIGADGFGIAMENGRWIKVPQIGRVVIGDDVEIGANTTVDRGALEDTIIEDGVKLDNQIQVAHNVRIGAHTAMAGCVGIAGSARIGKHCTVGGGAVILEQNRTEMRQNGIVIYLKASVHDLWQRTRNDRNRPLLQTDDPHAKLAELFQQRDAFYQQAADIVIQSGKSGVHTLMLQVVSNIEEFRTNNKR